MAELAAELAVTDEAVQEFSTPAEVQEASLKRRLEDEEQDGPSLKRAAIENGADGTHVQEEAGTHVQEEAGTHSEEVAVDPPEVDAPPSEDAPPGIDETPPGLGDEQPEQQPVTTEAAGEAAADEQQHVEAEAVAVVSGGQVTDYVPCPQDKLKRLIGKKGVTIRALEATSGARIQIEHDDTGETKRVRVTGTAEAVETAKADIIKTINSPEEGVPGEVSRSVECPQGIVGRVIGRGGETIKQLQSASGAHIAVDQNFPEGHPRKVNISGRQDCVDRATIMVTELIASEPNSLQAIIAKYSVGVTRKVAVVKSMVGKIIGKQGETIKHIQKTSGADSIQIDQKRDPCEVVITGKPNCADAAARMVQDILTQGDYGGGPQGGPGGYGPRGPAPYAPPYGNPYGPPQMAPGYGAPYGMPPGGPMPGYGYYGAQYPPYPAAQPMGYSAYGAYGAAAATDPYASSGAYGGAGGTYGASASTTANPSGAAGRTSIWQELQDNEGRTYYYNTQTGTSQWEKPADL